MIKTVLSQDRQDNFLLRSTTSIESQFVLHTAYSQSRHNNPYRNQKI